MELIGEAADHVSDEFQVAHPDIPPDPEPEP